MVTESLSKELRIDGVTVEDFGGSVEIGLDKTLAEEVRPSHCYPEQSRENIEVLPGKQAVPVSSGRDQLSSLSDR